MSHWKLYLKNINSLQIFWISLLADSSQIPQRIGQILMSFTGEVVDPVYQKLLINQFKTHLKFSQKMRFKMQDKNSVINFE